MNEKVVRFVARIRQSLIYESQAAIQIERWIQEGYRLGSNDMLVGRMKTDDEVIDSVVDSWKTQ